MSCDKEKLFPDGRLYKDFMLNYIPAKGKSKPMFSASKILILKAESLEELKKKIDEAGF